MSEIEPPEDASQNYRDGWADGMAGKGPDPDRCNGGHNRMNDYERGYVEGGQAERESKAAQP